MGVYAVELSGHLVMLYVLVVHYDLGITGVAIVTSVDYFVRFAT